MNLFDLARNAYNIYNAWQNLPGGQPGTWNIGPVNLKDRGVTEVLGATTGASQSTGGFNPTPTTQYDSPIGPPAPDLSGTQTTSGGTTNQGTIGGGTNEVDLARRIRENMINSYKAQAGNIRSNAEQTFADLIKAVNAFRERSGTLRDNAGQEIVNRASEIFGSNARTARDLEGETRAKGRAFGLGDSSKFKNQTRLAGQLAGQQGATLARRGEEDRANQALYQERQDQAQGQEDQANTYLRGARNQATALENAGFDTADSEFESRLNDLVNYQRSLAQINPLQAGGLTAYAPNFNGLPQMLNSIISAPQGSAQNTTDQFASPYNTVNWLDLLKRRQGTYVQ